jgi:hypothetical protein
MKNSAILLISDHGLHMHGVYRILDVEIVRMEISLPMLFIKLPNNKFFKNTNLTTALDYNQ